jgi:electron transfer flavoprotein alpha subunit
MKRPRPQAEEFHIGWIIALPVEIAAARAMLDEEYEDGKDISDYILGRISNHNIVVICLPAGKFGTTSAATAAAEMRFKFAADVYGVDDSYLNRMRDSVFKIHVCFEH